MKIAVLTWYDNNISEYGNIYLEINKLYCAQHDYDLIKTNRRFYKDKPATWERFPHLLNFIEKYDYVVWIDADAFFYYSAPPLEEIINRYQKDILLSADADTYLVPDSVNAGVFVLKNTKKVISLLNKWAFDEELANRFLNEKAPETQYWIEDQAMIRGCLKYNVDDMQSITKVLPYMELQHFNLCEFPILKRHNILPYVFHAAGRGSSFRYYISKTYLQEILKNPFSPFVCDKLEDKPILDLHHRQYPRRSDLDQDLAQAQAQE